MDLMPMVTEFLYSIFIYNQDINKVICVMLNILILVESKANVLAGFMST